MKKVPSIRMPDPKAGVIRSEHPRAVGPNGLVEAKNWILRNGSMQVRDGIKHVATPTRTLITPGSSWADEGGDVWSTALTTEPVAVYVDGELGTVDLTPDAAYEWYWDSNVLYLYATADPDTEYTDPGVEWTGDSDGTAVTSISSFDYQNGGSVVRDQLMVTTTDGVECYNNDLSVARTAVATDVDWSWDGAYGWAEDLSQPSGWSEWGRSSKISIDWSNIDWGVFGADTVGVAVRMRFSFYIPAGITLQLYEIYDSGGGVWASRNNADAVWILPGTDSTVLTHNTYTQGVPYQIGLDPAPIGAGDLDLTGIYMIFNDTWSSWYDEAAATGDYITQVDMPYYWACYDASEYGLPGGDPVVNLDSTKRPVVRTWDYEQVTHNLIAAEDSFILDVDSDALSSPPDPTVSISGDAGVCPRAKAIGIASQRIIAGNVSYFDSQATMTENEDAIEANNWHLVVDQFAYFPDAVVYSGTVLTGGHESWYPADILRLADTPGEVVAIQEMGTQMAAVYKTDAIYTLTAQTGISPFAPSLRASGMQGPVSPRSVVAISDTTHIYLARDGGVYMFSGAYPQSLGDQFREWVSREIDPDYSYLSFVIFDPERNEIHAYYPVKGSGGVVRKGLVIDVSKQPFTGWPVLWPKQVYNGIEDALQDLNFLCASMHYEGNQDIVTSDITIPASEVVANPTTKYQELYLGTENDPLTTGDRSAVEDGRIFKTADTGNDHGVAIVSSFETGISDLGDPDSQKVILEIELLFDNISDISGGDSISVDVTVYGGDSNKNLSQLWQETDVSIASGQITVHPRVRARYFSVEVEVTAAVEDYDESGRDWSQNFGEIEYYGAIVRYKPSGVRQN